MYLSFPFSGHSPTKDYAVNPNLIDATESSSFPLSLDEQIMHKKIFLEEHIPSKSKIILIGHSIGAYVILHLLKICNRATDVIKSILLFPTIERMAISPSGRYVTPMVTYFKWFAIAAVTAFSCLPEFVKKGLVQWWLSSKKNLMSSLVDTVLKLLTPQSVNGCLTMAHDEMREVVDPDEEVCYEIIPGLQSALQHE